MYFDLDYHPFLLYDQVLKSKISTELLDLLSLEKLKNFSTKRIIHTFTRDHFHKISTSDLPQVSIFKLVSFFSYGFIFRKINL